MSNNSSPLIISKITENEVVLSANQDIKQGDKLHIKKDELNLFALVAQWTTEEQEKEFKRREKNACKNAVSLFKGSEIYKKLEAEKAKAEDELTSEKLKWQNEKLALEKDKDNEKLKEITLLKDANNNEVVRLKEEIATKAAEITIAVANFKNSDEYTKIVQENLTNAEKIEEFSKKEQIIRTEAKAEAEKKYEEIINNLKRGRGTTSQQQGESLESWCLKEIQSCFNGDEAIWFGKPKTKSSETKADLICAFKNANNEDNFTVTIECKTFNASIDGNDGSTKNKQHYKKLLSDAKKQKSKFAILVTELEPKETFLLQVIKEIELQEFSDISLYVCRPAALTTILTILKVQNTQLNNLNLRFANPDCKIKKDFIEIFEELREDTKKSIINFDIEYRNICEDLDKIIKISNSIKTTSLTKLLSQFKKIKKQVEEINPKVNKQFKKINAEDLMENQITQNIDDDLKKIF